MPGALLAPRGRAERDGHGPCCLGACVLGGVTEDTIPKGTNKSEGDASCEGGGGKGARRGRGGLLWSRVGREGLSGCRAGARPEMEAEEKHGTGSKNKGPEARASWATVAVAE